MTNLPVLYQNNLQFRAVYEGLCANGNAVVSGLIGSKHSFLVKSLFDQHPDVTAITKKFNRWHHHVDYSGFIQKPIYKDGIVPQPELGNNEYGMVYRKPTDEEQVAMDAHWE